jgi:hypothetical protein
MFALSWAASTRNQKFGLAIAAAATAIAVAGTAPIRSGLGAAKVDVGSDRSPTNLTAGHFAVGTNLDGLAYWSSATPIIDLTKASNPWLMQTVNRWDTKEPVAQDQFGWVRSLPTASDPEPRMAGLIVLRDAGTAAPPNGRYVLLHDGEGTMIGMIGTKVLDAAPGRMLIQAADNGWLHLQITATDPKHNGNYLRNLRIIAQDRLAAYHAGEIFNPGWLETVRGFQAFRFMDWMATNSLFRPDGSAVVLSSSGEGALSAAQLRWVDRPQMGDAFWNRGVPVEAMVRLANQTGADPWFNMPINASDDYVRGFASYVRRHLGTARKVHVELSNEVWNWSFVQAHYANARAEQEWGKGANRMEWYGKRAAEIGLIWNTVFGEAVRGGDPGRVRIVYNTQFVYKGMETPGLETPSWRDARGRQRRAADYFDEYAVTGYYGGGLSEDGNAHEVMSWWRQPDGGFGRALQALREGIEKTNAPLYAYHGEQARRYGLDLVTYESGFGERTPISQHGNDEYTNFLVALQRRPEIYDLEMRNAAAFRRAGGSLFMNFGLIGKPGKWGSWSALESVEQRTSPRYRALREMIRLNSVPRPKREETRAFVRRTASRD